MNSSQKTNSSTLPFAPSACFAPLREILLNKILFVLFVLFVVNSPSSILHAQTAAEMDTLLTRQTINAAQASRYVLGAAGLLPDELSGAEAETAAYNIARSNGWIMRSRGEAVTLKDTAFLVMNAFEIKGGIMYSLFANPRYAYREMLYLKLIQGRSDQSMLVSGRRLLQIIDRTVNYTGQGGNN